MTRGVAAIAAPLPWGASADSSLSTEVTHESDFGSYNNYFEFSSDKRAVKHLAQELNTQNWVLTIEGDVKRSVQWDIDDLRRRFKLQEPIYPMRCIEGWSAVVPWQGIALAELLKWVEPTGSARFVEFVSAHRPAEMLGQRNRISGLSWPYREGLRIDEAMHPLTLMALGAYGKPLAKQNGAPIRLVVPWKYGFKSAKAITTIRLRETMPQSSWSLLAPSDYGFYGNVNPKQVHPRWNQARELRLGENRKRPTLPFNGFADQVASLYAGMSPHLLF